MTNQQLLERAMVLAITAPTDTQYKKAMRLVTEISASMSNAEIHAAKNATRTRIRSVWGAHD
jgi:hypothetical protein